MVATCPGLLIDRLATGTCSHPVGGVSIPPSFHFFSRIEVRAYLEDEGCTQPREFPLGRVC
jgi:hypothetical protein